jgi:hypothetical protein
MERSALYSLSETRTRFKEDCDFITRHSSLCHFVTHPFAHSRSGV